MNKHVLIDALPATLSLLAALVDATLTWAGVLHPSSVAAALYVSLALALGRGLSVWLHNQLILESVPPPAPTPTPPAPPTGVAG